MIFKMQTALSEMIGFPEETSIEGGYDFKGILDIRVGSYAVHCEEVYSSTGTLHRLLNSLTTCYNLLEGTAEYRHMYDKDFEFSLKMTNCGHAILDGIFREHAASPNQLIFQMETDQTFILNTINDLRQVEKYSAVI